MLQERGARRGQETGRPWRRFPAASAPHVPVWPAAVLTAGALLESVIRAASHHRTEDSGVLLTSAFLAVAATAPLSFLGPFGAATAVVAASVLALTTTGVLPVASAAAVVVAMYRLGWDGNAAGAGAVGGTVRGRRLPTVSAVAAGAAVALSVPFPVIALSVSRSSDAGVISVLLTALAPAAAFAGNAAHARSQARVHQAARDVVARSLVEHTARGERARIARELHDVVAHHISMIAVQAESARLATPGMPAAGAEQLLAIGDTARAGLTEMRRLLGVLREDAGPVDQEQERHPQPGLDQLLALVDAARQTSGATTRLIVSGTPEALDPGVELAAYRITQEALTNARRHAQGAPVDVELHFTEAALRLRIRDCGPGTGPLHQDSVADPADTAGHGVPGMRERAAAVGGRLTAGPSPTGGFLVEAVLPAGSGDGSDGGVL